MVFTDTHVHLADEALFCRLPEVLARARAAGVCRFVAPSAQRCDWPLIEGMAGGGVVPALGLHPWFAGQDGDLDGLDAFLGRNPRAWVGEIGLDYRRAPSPAERAAQRDLCAKQLDLARQYGRPVILHCVAASADLALLLKRSAVPGGIVHAFSGSLEEAGVWMRLGFKIGMGSLLLNPNAKKARAAAALLPLDALVLETDSPFMLKGGINMPENVRRVAEEVCALRGMGLDALAAATEANTDALLV
ncbi:MAG: TatD family hydrolase [Neisseria sp.]|nr:TatD family hydrolase [Neisseria sp.]